MKDLILEMVFKGIGFLQSQVLYLKGVWSSFIQFLLYRYFFFFFLTVWEILLTLEISYFSHNPWRNSQL